MKQQIEHRLKDLKTEFESGQKMLADLEAKRGNLKETLLRISGAIMVLEEELRKADNDNGKAEKQFNLKQTEQPELEKQAAAK